MDESRFRLANLTELPFTADASAVEIAYEDDDLLTHVVPVSCTDEIVLPPADEPGQRGPESGAICSMPAANALPAPPAVRGAFTIVVRGQHGARGSSADPGSWTTSDFVTAFHRQVPTIVYDSTRVDLHVPEADVDIRFQLGIYQQPIDPLRGLIEDPANVNRVSPSETSLTVPLRVATDRPELDFIRAVQEAPLGRRIAVRSDAFHSPSAGNFENVGAALDVVLLDPTVDPTNAAALELVPDSRLMGIDREPLPAVWSADGAALFPHGLLFAELTGARSLEVHGCGAQGGARPRLELPARRGDDHPLGDYYDYCSRVIDGVHLSATTDSHLAVTVTCERGRVVHDGFEKVVTFLGPISL